MLLKLFILFVTVPIIELFLLAKMGAAIGWPETFALVLFTGMTGAYLAKREGLDALASIRKAGAEGRVPTLELLDGAMILASGLLLITPGILTDAVGFLLLIPSVRTRFRHSLALRWKRHIVMNVAPGWEPQGGGDNACRPENTVIDVRAESVRDADP
ncbi:MAG: FxsA family protein [Lentisphaeria bacterium]|nr:FxsA family protein [Lentisphaeria bacterium]